jgi:hypothetical protein
VETGSTEEVGTVRLYQVNNGYNYSLGVVHERSGVDCLIRALGSSYAPGRRSSRRLPTPIVDPRV